MGGETNYDFVLVLVLVLDLDQHRVMTVAMIVVEVPMIVKNWDRRRQGRQRGGRS